MTPPKKPRAPSARKLKAVKDANTAALLLEEQNEKARKALEMRRAGQSWWVIAETLQVSESKAQELQQHAINDAARMVDSAFKRELLALEVDRLDTLQNAIWSQAMAGDIASVREARGIIMDRAKLLKMDVPSEDDKVQRTVIVPSDSYVAALQQIHESRELTDGNG